MFGGALSSTQGLLSRQTVCNVTVTHHDSPNIRVIVTVAQFDNSDYKGKAVVLLGVSAIFSLLFSPCFNVLNDIFYNTSRMQLN